MGVDITAIPKTEQFVKECVGSESRLKDRTLTCQTQFNFWGGHASSNSASALTKVVKLRHHGESENYHYKLNERIRAFR